MESEGGAPGAGERVHVRRLDVADTLRWSWYALTDHLELVALTFAVQLLSVATTVGVTQSSPTDVPAVADWVWPAYLAYFLALAVAWGAYYLTAADAVADRPRRLRDHVRVAATRLPALVAAALLLWSPVVVWFVLLAVAPAEFVPLALLAASAIPGLYLFHRLLLVFPACVVDRKGPLAGLRSSWRAGGGAVRKVFAVTVAYVVLTYGSGVVAGFFGGTYSTTSAVVSAVFGAVLGPVYGLALGHLYLEGSRNR